MRARVYKTNASVTTNYNYTNAMQLFMIYVR